MLPWVQIALLGREICDPGVSLQRRCLGEAPKRVRLSVLRRLNDEVLRVLRPVDAVYILFQELSAPECLLVKLRVIRSDLVIVVFHQSK